MSRVPVIALTGHLGAGKTTLLNRLLRAPGARVGVVVNDFGAINVDAGLIAGQVDDAAAITGGCVCCLPDTGGLDDALNRLTDPRLRLDAVIVEASGVADPITLARLIRFSGAEHARPGGLIDVVDSVEFSRTVDTGVLPPARFAAATLVAVTKLDRLPGPERDRRLAALAARVRERNPDVPVVRAEHGRIDPALVFDVAQAEDPPDQLPIAALLREAAEHEHPHTHAFAVTVAAPHPVDAGALVDLLEDPPTGAYRIKGCVEVRTARGSRRSLVNLVGRSIHIASAPLPSAGSDEAPAEDEASGAVGAGEDGLVAIGMDLVETEARVRLAAALAPAASAPAAGLRRLQRYLRLSR